MPFDKETASQAGRKSSRKGVSNKNIDEIRAAFRELTEANMDKVQGWLDQVAAEDPNSALDKFLKLAEYVLPKLARVETTHEAGENLKTFTIQIEGSDE
jgi:hypothetical protein